jgi:hypothetical protein
MPLPGRLVARRSALDRETVVRIHPGQLSRQPSDSNANMCSMRERVRELLRAGWTRRRIADELGLDPSTITRHARRLGWPDRAPRLSPVNWKAVQAFYDGVTPSRSAGSGSDFRMALGIRLLRAVRSGQGRAQRANLHFRPVIGSSDFGAGEESGWDCRSPWDLEVTRRISLPPARYSRGPSICASIRLDRRSTSHR